MSKVPVAENRDRTAVTGHGPQHPIELLLRHGLRQIDGPDKDAGSEAA
ncbi:MAG: hypothetical protein O2820_07680 [Planctomycetota bacterium]|nr:hypothetical protein [Planctomycetota bacterium]MDA1249092.1 hypothetical protein [Planctomycetota bacterium]